MQKAFLLSIIIVRMTHIGQPILYYIFYGISTPNPVELFLRSCFYEKRV